MQESVEALGLDDGVEQCGKRADNEALRDTRCGLHRTVIIDPWQVMVTGPGSNMRSPRK
jgi:hypothetical protein